MQGYELGAVIMVGSAGESPQEQLMLAAQRASALDLVHTLRSQGINRIIIAAPTTEWLPADLDVIRDNDPVSERFHFGDRLARLIEAYHIEPLLYFGGGSAPLVDDSLSGMIVGLLDRSLHATAASIPSHIVLTNNLHSSDWAAISRVDAALPIIRQASRDNSLAWLLHESGDYEVRVLAGVRPSTSMDLDTPSDLAVVARHPDLLTRLQQIVIDERLPKIPVDPALKLFGAEA